MLAGRGQHLNGNALQRNGVARFHYHMQNRDALQNLNVVGVVFFHHARVLHVGAVIDESADLHAVSQLGDAAHVIAMVVGDENIVELFDFGGFGGLDNAVGVTTVETAPACVDQQGVAGGSDDERGLAALHIDKIDFERLGGNERKREGSGYGENRSEEHTSELQSLRHLVCRLL